MSQPFITQYIHTHADLGPNDVVIHYRAPFFKFRGKSPHGVTRENLSHTAPLYCKFSGFEESYRADA